MRKLLKILGNIAISFYFNSLEMLTKVRGIMLMIIDTIKYNRIFSIHFIYTLKKLNILIF